MLHSFQSCQRINPGISCKMWLRMGDWKSESLHSMMVSLRSSRLLSEINMNWHIHPRLERYRSRGLENDFGISNPLRRE
jgi:hypothetical protein